MLRSKVTTDTTSSARAFDTFESLLSAAIWVMTSTMRQASLKLAAAALRKISLETSRARVRSGETYSPTWESFDE